MRFNNRARQIKSQSGAFSMFNRLSRTIKTIEDMRQVLGFNARTFITDTDNDLLWSCRATDLDLTIWRIFECIGNKVDHHLFPMHSNMRQMVRSRSVALHDQSRSLSVSVMKVRALKPRTCRISSIVFIVRLRRLNI